MTPFEIVTSPTAINNVYIYAMRTKPNNPINQANCIAAISDIEPARLIDNRWNLRLVTPNVAIIDATFSLLHPDADEDPRIIEGIYLQYRLADPVQVFASQVFAHGFLLINSTKQFTAQLQLIVGKYSS